MRILTKYNLVLCSRLNAVPDPDLEIRGGGEERGSSRPLEKGGLQNYFFGPSGLSLV